MFNLKKVFGMNKTQVVTLFKVIEVDAGTSIAWAYDESVQLSHRPVVVKRIIVSSTSDSEKISFVRVGGFLTYTGKAWYSDPEKNAGMNIETYAFDDKKVHEVNLYMQDGYYFPLQLSAICENSGAVSSFCQVGIYIEFEVL